MIDEIDYKILTILQEKARIPNAEVARQVGMAPSAVLERIRKLEEREIIEGYDVRLNPQAFNQGLTAFVRVCSSAAPIDDLAKRLGEIPGVQEIHQVAGEDGMVLKIRAADNQDLGRILNREINSLDGVTHTRTQVVLNTFKETRKIHLTRIED